MARSPGAQGQETTRQFELPEGTEGKIVVAILIAIAAAALVYVAVKLPDIMSRLNGR